jgi:hypothetical protein
MENNNTLIQYDFQSIPVIDIGSFVKNETNNEQEKVAK